jgi:hypothetical protein
LLAELAAAGRVVKKTIPALSALRDADLHNYGVMGLRSVRLSETISVIAQVLKKR